MLPKPGVVVVVRENASRLSKPVQQHLDVNEVAATNGTRTYAVLACVFASLGGLFFGYDQGVTGGVLVMDSFIDDWCVGWHEQTYHACRTKARVLPERWLAYTLWYNLTYNVGCIFGALIGGWVADAFGRRVTIFTAGLLFCIGTSWVSSCTAGAHTSLLVARAIQGVGVGNSSFSLPILGAELAPRELRGFLSGFMQMTIVTGVLLANIVNWILEGHAQGWRIANAIAMAAPLVVMLGIFFVPESPRWTYQRDGEDAAAAVLQRLRQTPDVRRELQAIRDQVAAEGSEFATWRELLQQASIRKRVAIAMALQVLQQATGINPMLAYGGLMFKDVVGDGVVSVLVLALVNFVGTVPAMRWVDTCGRRQLLLLGAVGMVLGHVVAGVTFAAGCDATAHDAGCSRLAGVGVLAGSALFVFHFALSWGPVCWIYPAEIFPLHVRAKAVSLSTMANWSMGTAMAWVVQLVPSLNIDGVFFVFAATCTLAGLFVYRWCPETRGLLLEDIDALFGGGSLASAAATTTTAVKHKSAKYERVATTSAV